MSAYILVNMIFLQERKASKAEIKEARKFWEGSTIAMRNYIE